MTRSAPQRVERCSSAPTPARENADKVAETFDAGTAAVDSGIAVIDTGNGLVPVFFAQGHLGRTVISCDDGKTWLHDRSDDDAGQCWVAGANSVECDHQPTSNAGIDSGDGWLFASFGHGSNGTVRASRDGAQWKIINANLKDRLPSALQDIEGPDCRAVASRSPVAGGTALVFHCKALADFHRDRELGLRLGKKVIHHPSQPRHRGSKLGTKTSQASRGP